MHLDIRNIYVKELWAHCVARRGPCDGAGMLVDRGAGVRFEERGMRVDVEGGLERLIVP